MPQTFPDPMPLREALRGLRHLLRRGGETLAETLGDNLPASAVEGGKGLAHLANDIASDVARKVLGGDAAPSDTLAQLTEAEFGAALYTALRSVLKRLGADGVFVSEAAAREVFTRDPAALALGLVQAHVIRGATAEEAARVPGAALEPVAIFAVLLWLQAARTDAENEAVLDAATDLAIAKAPEIAAIMAARDHTGIGKLFARLVPHV